MTISLDTDTITLPGSVKDRETVYEGMTAEEAARESNTSQFIDRVIKALRERQAAGKFKNTPSQVCHAVIDRVAANR